MEETLGPEKATTLHTYTAMKCGMKNVSSSGNNGTIISNGAIMSQKAQKRFDDYTALAKEKYPDSWEGRELDGELLYEASGGIPHGRVSIGDGAVKKADIKSAARKRNASASISLTLREKEQLRRVNEENAELRRAKEMLQQKVEMHGQLIIALFKEIGKEVPAHILGHGTVSQPEGTSNSSQAGSQAVDGNNDVNDTTENVGDQTVDAANLGKN